LGPKNVVSTRFGVICCGACLSECRNGTRCCSSVETALDYVVRPKRIMDIVRDSSIHPFVAYARLTTGSMVRKSSLFAPKTRTEEWDAFVRSFVLECRLVRKLL
jgi:hypothetical protein